MIKEAFGTADTVEEALEDAKAQLFAMVGEDADFDIDVISQPKKKVLGLFGGCLAQVRVYTEVADSQPKKAPKKSVKKENKKQEKVEKPKQEKKTSPTEEINAVDVSELPDNCPAINAVNYIKPILDSLGCSNVDIKVCPKDNGALLLLSGDGLGACIGRRGETLDALQYLCSLSANTANGYYKISIDIGNYRERREKALISLAQKICAQVLRTGRNRSLEPMNPYERRIIHTAVQEIEGVVSASVGDGASRRVVIAVEGKPIRDNSGRPQRNGSRRGRDSSRRTPAAAPTQNENNKPKETDGTKLYGRLDK